MMPSCVFVGAANQSGADGDGASRSNERQMFSSTV